MVHVIPKFILILDLGRFYREHLPPYKGVHPGLWLFILSGAMEVVGLVGLTILPSHNHKTFQVYTKDWTTVAYLLAGRMPAERAHKDPKGLEVEIRFKN